MQRNGTTKLFAQFSNLPSPLKPRFSRPIRRDLVAWRYFSCRSSPRAFTSRCSWKAPIHPYHEPLRQSSYKSIRSISTEPFPRNRGPVFRFFYRCFAYAGGFVLVSGSLVLAFFVYDASTYREDLSYTDIPVSEHALFPRRGGPKNLPIAETLVDDDDCAENQRAKHKPKLVILGSGWGSVSLLKTLNPEDYHVTVLSPVNYFLFTPMLPSATVGTLELRSLVEPVRRIVQRARGHFIKGEAVDVELSEKLIEVAQTNATGVVSRFYLPYDKLVIGVGKFCPFRLAECSVRLTIQFRRNHEPSRRQRPGELSLSQRHRGCAVDQEQSDAELRGSLHTYNV